MNRLLKNFLILKQSFSSKRYLFKDSKKAQKIQEQFVKLVQSCRSGVSIVN